MNNGSGLHVVLGASGGIGIVRELVSRRHRVRAVSRSAPEGIEGVRADVSAPEDARAAVSGASVVYHAAQPDYSKWPEEFPPMTDAVIEGAAAAGAKLVFADNLYMYGPQPMNEETPPKATGKKGRTRALMAARLSQAHRSGRVLVTIGRASVYYGPGGTGSLAGETLFGEVLAGKTVRWPASLDVPHQFNYLPDVARTIAWFRGR